MPVHNRSLMYYLAIGLVQGLILVAASSELVEGMLAKFVLCAASIVVSVNLQLLGREQLQRGTLLLVALLATLVGGISAWTHSLDASGSLWEIWWLAAVLLSYICTAFILSWPTREGRTPRYEDLFRHAWNNAFIVFLACNLMGVFWWLLWLCGQLFSMVGIGLVEEAVQTPKVAMLVLPVVFSLGMRIGLENEKIIGMLRGMLLALCRFLLPLSALIAVVFTLALPFSGLEPIWATGKSTIILLVLAVFNLFLVNGVFQDGHSGQAYPTALKRLVDASLLCLPVLMVLAAWSSWLRVEQYGLTPSRLLALLLVVVMLVHGLAAAWAVLRSRGVWLGSLRTSNPLIALLTALLIVAYFSPLLDPLGLSARNQVARLLDGRTPIAEFDAGTLYRSLGKPGRAAFDELEQRLKTDELFDAAKREELSEVMSGVYRPVREQRSRIEWLGAEAPQAEALVELLKKRGDCTGRGCYLWAADMDGDGREEALVIPRQAYSSALIFYAWAGEEWTRIGTFSVNSRVKNMDEVVKQIQAGTLKPVTPKYKALSVDGNELTFNRDW